MDRAGVGHRLKQQLTEVSGLADGSLIGHPFSMGSSRTSMRLADGTLWYMREYLVDAGFFDVLDIQVKAGRVFDAERPTDAATSIVVNEALVKKFGWERTGRSASEGLRRMGDRRRSAGDRGCRRLPLLVLADRSRASGVAQRARPHPIEPFSAIRRYEDEGCGGRTRARLGARSARRSLSTLVPG